MREKTYYSGRPERYEIKDAGDGMKTVCFRLNIEETESPEGTQYSADEYILCVTGTDKLGERIEGSFEAWAGKAVREDYEREAARVRAYRDRLLAETDREMCLDRLGLEVPAGISFSEWLSFFRKLGAAVIGDMAKYRQALRDLPSQPGFPYDVIFPVRPNL